MTTRGQILKDIIIDDIKNNKPKLDIVNHCYDILSVLYCSLEERLYDWAYDIVDDIIIFGDDAKIRIGGINND